jgi:hypothetical protein
MPEIGPNSREEWIIREAQNRPTEERAAFLDGACAGDMELRERIEALLLAQKQVSDALGPTVADDFALLALCLLPIDRAGLIGG